MKKVKEFFLPRDFDSFCICCIQKGMWMDCMIIQIWSISYHWFCLRLKNILGNGSWQFDMLGWV